MVIYTNKNGIEYNNTKGCEMKWLIKNAEIIKNGTVIKRRRRMVFHYVR